MTIDIAKKDNVKTLYNLIEDKKKFIKDCAASFKREPSTLINHWFSEGRFYSVPKTEIDEVINYMQNVIKQQNKIKA